MTAREPLAGIDVGDPGALFTFEKIWCSLQPWLQERGYRLRARFQPSWVPSWKGTRKHYSTCEDGQSYKRARLIDAVRISDGSYVMLKRVTQADHPYEAEIGQYFSSGALLKDPKNHCVPILEVLPIPDRPDEIIIVMPLLRKFNDPPFQTVGEVVEMISQVFEGLEFMHKHHVAHRDCNGSNIMMDASALFPESYHPVKINRSRDWRTEAKHLSRSQVHPRYYLIDFGLSRQYGPEIGEPSEKVILSGDKSVPEHSDLAAFVNPFPTDVYLIGNMVRENFLLTTRGLDCLQPLVDKMVNQSPLERPDMTKVISEFENIKRSLSSRSLASRAASRKESFLVGFILDVQHQGKRLLGQK